MKIENMTSPNGNKVANQFIVFTPDATWFQSYSTMIIKITFEDGKRVVYLDENAWDYSRTTAKYRNMFLNEDSKTIQKKIKSSEYRLTNLN